MSIQELGTTLELDQLSTEAFAEKLLGILNGGALALMLSIGHRTGLLDTMAELPPSTSEQIAKAAGLNERYVREWLGTMVTGRIVNYDSLNVKYELPPEHAAMLTRAASPNNFAVTMQFMSVMGQVEDRVVECFRHGGGVPYSAYPRFHEVMAEESAQTVLATLLDTILPLAPGLTERLRDGIKVLDIGCGRGLALILMAESFPNSVYTGYDFSEEAIASGKAEAERKGLTNISFAVRDTAVITEKESFDLITAFDAIHDQAHPARVLQNISNALKEDGTFLMQDIAGSSHLHKNMDHPIGPFSYTISCMHCMTVSLALEGDGLGTMWGEEKAEQMLADAGFKSVEVKKLEHDFINYYYIAGKM